MSFNGSGVWNPPPGQPVSPGTIISADTHNTLVTDIGNTFNNTLPRDGQAPMTGQLRLVSGTEVNPSITFNAESTTGLFRPVAGTLALSVSGSEKIRVTSGGNLLIGTTSDSGGYKLDVNGGIRASSITVTGPFNIPNATGLPFTANGTGATTRNVDSKLKDFINVLDFLTPEQINNAYLRLGTLDMGPQLQKAIDAAANSTLYWPANYVFASAQELIIRRAQIWQGGGRGNVRSPFSTDTRTNTELRTLGDGTAYKTVKTRVRYRGAQGDAEDAPLSALVNVQAQGVEIRDMTIRCSYNDTLIRQVPAPLALPYLGDDWDCGIFVGCRLHFKIRNVAVIGCWRDAAVYCDVTRDPSLPELFGWDGIQHIDDSPHGGDGCTISELMTWGGKWGVKVRGPDPKPGLQSYGRDYIVSLYAQFNSLPVEGDTITLGDVVFTFTTSPSADTEVAIGTTIQEAASNLQQAASTVRGSDAVAYKFRLAAYVADGNILRVFREETNTSDTRFDTQYTATVSAGGRITLSSTTPTTTADPAPYCDRTATRITAPLAIQDQRGAYGFSDFCIEHSQIHGSHSPIAYARDAIRADKNWLIDTGGGAFYIDGLAGNGSRCLQGHRYFNVRFDGHYDPFNVRLGRTHRDDFIGCHWDGAVTGYKNPDGTWACSLNADGSNPNIKLGKYGPTTNIPGITTRTRFFGRTSTPYPEYFYSWDVGSGNVVDSSGRTELPGYVKTEQIYIDKSIRADGSARLMLKGGTAGSSRLYWNNPNGVQASLNYYYGSGNFRLAFGGNVNGVLWQRDDATTVRTTMTPTGTGTGGTGVFDSTGAARLEAYSGYEAEMRAGTGSLLRFRVGVATVMTVSASGLTFGASAASSIITASGTQELDLRSDTGFRYRIGTSSLMTIDASGLAFSTAATSSKITGKTGQNLDLQTDTAVRLRVGSSNILSATSTGVSVGDGTGALTAGSITASTVTATNTFKAWGQFRGDGASVGLQYGYNVSSVGRTPSGLAAGDYTVNFGTALSSSSYVILRSTDYNSTIDGNWIASSEIISQTTTGFRITTGQSNSDVLRVEFGVLA